MYLLPLFLLTAQDMALTGLINDSRKMLLDVGEDGSLIATLYGMMASYGYGDFSTMHRLIYLETKITFLLMLAISMPIMFECEYKFIYLFLISRGACNR